MKLKNNLMKLFAVAALSNLTANSVFADCWYNTRRDNGNVNIYYDASVAAYYYGSLIDNARSDWSSISTEVKLYHSTSTVNAPDKYYVGDSDPYLTTTLGFMVPYKKLANGSIVIAEKDDTWHYCTVSLFHETMNIVNWTTNAHRQSVITHEMGHTLKLHHPGQGTQRIQPMGAGNTSIMHAIDLVYSIQPYDEQELKFKWGN